MCSHARTPTWAVIGRAFSSQEGLKGQNITAQVGVRACEHVGLGNVRMHRVLKGRHKLD